MPLPVAWNKITVSWDSLYVNGQPVNGRVLFRPEVEIVEVSGVSVVPATITANIVDGVMEPVDLPSTDDPDITPVGWAWTVDAVFIGAPDVIRISVPVAGGPIDLSSPTYWMTPPDPGPGCFTTCAEFDILSGEVDSLSDSIVEVDADLTVVENGLAATGTELDALGETVEDLGSSLDGINFAINGHIFDLNNPHAVTKAQVGLPLADNTSDVGKPVSTAQAAADAAVTAAAAVDATAKANTKVPKVDLNQTPTFIYGNSYSILSAAYFTSGNHWTQQVAAHLNGGAVTSYGIGAKRILDVMSGLINEFVLPNLVTAPIAGARWPGVATRTGLTVLESLINDIGHYPTMVGTAIPAALPSANTRYKDSLTLQYRAALALMSSASRVEQSARTATSGTWTHDSAAAYASGGTVSFTSVAGSYIEYTITPPQSGPLAGVVFGHGYTLDAGLGTMAQQTVSVDGVVQTTRTPSAWEMYTGPAGGNVNVSVDCFPITLPVDGAAHVIRIAHSGTAAQFVYSDFISVPSVTPNPIIVPGAEHALAYTGWTAAQLGNYHANAKALIPIFKAVIAEFPHAVYAPSTITPNGLWTTDRIHPNDRGMAQRANDVEVAIFTALRNRYASAVLASTPDGSFPIV